MKQTFLRKWKVCEIIVFFCAFFYKKNVFFVVFGAKRRGFFCGFWSFFVVFGREAADLVEDGSPAERLYSKLFAPPVCSKMAIGRPDTTRHGTATR